MRRNPQIKLKELKKPDFHNIKFIYFDVGNVLVKRMRTANSHIAEEINISEPDLKIARTTIDEEYNHEFYFKNIEIQKAFFKEYFEKLLKFLKIDYNDLLIEKICNMELNQDYKLMPQVVETLEQLKEKYRLGILSNSAPSRRFNELKLGNIDTFFEEIVLSSEIGIRKPDRRIFEYAIEKSGVRASEILFIDDEMDNLIASKAAGISNVFWHSEYRDPRFFAISSISQLLNFI